MPSTAHASMGVVSVGHDIFWLSLVPSDQQLSHAIKVELWVVCLRHDVLHVRRLEIDILRPGHLGQRVSNPQLLVSFSFFLRWNFYFPKDDISRKPGHHVEHVESKVLVLHAKVVDLGVVVEHDAFPEVVRVHDVGGSQLEIVVQERIVVQVASAQDDGIDVFGCGPIFEDCGLPVHFFQKRTRLHIFRPIIIHRVGPVRRCDAFATVFEELRGNVLG